MNRQRRNNLRFLRVTALCAMAAASLAAVAWTAGYRLNETASLPRGVWRVTDDLPPVIERGTIVHFCPPDIDALRLARERGYIGSGPCANDYEPMFKPVVAIAGDLVTVNTLGVMVNGVLLPNTTPLAADPAHGPLPQQFGTTVVERGAIWVVSSHNARSFDSRYFGPISQRQLLGRADPVLIEQSAP